MRHLHAFAIALSLILLTACASTTPYQAASKPGAFDGYSQTMLENDRVRVTFGGNSLTDRETVENYLLYRAAEVAVEKGFDYFSLTQRDTETKTRVNVNPRFGLYDPYFDYAFFRPRFGWSRFHAFSHFHDPYFRHSSRHGFGPWGNKHDPFFNDYDVREVTKYRATAEVRLGRGAKPDADNTFNAKEVLTNLAPIIVYPEEKA